MKSSIDLTDNKDFRSDNFVKKSMKVKSKYFDNENDEYKRVPWKCDGTLLYNHEITYSWTSVDGQHLTFTTHYTQTNTWTTFNNSTYYEFDVLDNNTTIYSNEFNNFNWFTNTGGSSTLHYEYYKSTNSEYISSDNRTLYFSSGFNNDFRTGKVKDIRRAYYTSARKYMEYAKRKYKLWNISEYKDDEYYKNKISVCKRKAVVDICMLHYKDYVPELYEISPALVGRCQVSDFKHSRLHYYYNNKSILGKVGEYNIKRYNLIKRDKNSNKIDWPNFYDDYLRETLYNLKPRNDWRNGKKIDNIETELIV